jgi:tetratricopeptide (TPR) repeat protein
MADDPQLRKELAKLQAALQAQEGLRGIIPDEQLNPILESLREKREALLAQLAGSGAIAQSGGVAAGASGVAVSGDVHGNIVLVTPPTAVPVSPRPKLYHNLPQPDYGQFIGREKELAKIHQLLLPYPRSRYHIITIDGIGGIGKSALALEAACRYVRDWATLPDDERFDAVIWVSAKQTVLTAEGIISRHTELHSLNDIYTTIAVTLERGDIAQARVEERSAMIAHALTRQRTLLIIDNLETVDDEQVVAFIREVPDPTKVIVTTRQRIDAAQSVRLVEMPWEDAQNLIAQECEKKNVELDSKDARRLYDRTGGVPLALVWSVSRVALGEGIDTILRRLGHPSNDIAQFCLEGVMQTLRGDDTYELLVASALFAQDAPREALCYVAGVKDEMSCADGLILLERLSLLNRYADQFSLLPLTRSYLEHELNQMPDFARAAYERMAAYYTQLVSVPPEARTGVPYWDGSLYNADAPRLQREWKNLEHIIQWTLDERRYNTALALFLPIVHLLNAWGLWDERLRLGRGMCQAANCLGDSSEAWLWIDAIGWVCLQRRQALECINALKSGRLVAQQFGLADALIQADILEARLYSAIGDIDLARRRIESVLKQIDLDSALKHESRVHRMIASRVAGAAVVLSETEGDFVRAREWGERELELRRASGENPSPVLARLGHLALELDDIASAERFLIQALVSAGPKDLASINYGLALVAEQKGERREARHLCELAIEQFGRLGMEERLQRARQQLARLQR